MIRWPRLLTAMLSLGGGVLFAQTPAPPSKSADAPGAAYKIDIVFPFDAQVYVDGKLLVDVSEKPILTPATIQNVPAGIHEVAVAKEGFTDMVKVISLTSHVDNLKFTQVTGKSQLLTKETGKICFARPTPMPAPAPATQATSAPAPQAEGEKVPLPPKPLGPINQGPLVGKKRDLPSGEVELQYSFEEESEAGDFKRMTGRTQAAWAPGHIILRNHVGQPGLIGIALRSPMEIHKLSVKGKILVGDHLLWFANVSTPKEEGDWKWRPAQGAVGVWRADGAFFVLNARPTEPKGPGPLAPAPFDFDVTFTPDHPGKPADTWKVNWQQYGKRFAPEASLGLNTTEPGYFGIGTWGSDVIIIEITLVGILPKP